MPVDSGHDARPRGRSSIGLGEVSRRSERRRATARRAAGRHTRSQRRGSKYGPTADEASPQAVLTRVGKQHQRGLLVGPAHPTEELIPTSSVIGQHQPRRNGIGDRRPGTASPDSCRAGTRGTALVLRHGGRIPSTGTRSPPRHHAQPTPYHRHPILRRSWTFALSLRPSHFNMPDRRLASERAA